VLFSFEGDHNANYGHGHGHVTFLDQHYETIRELRAGNHKLVDKHEFHIVDNGEHGLIQIYQPVPRNLTAWGASSEQQWIVNAIIQGMWEGVPFTGNEADCCHLEKNSTLRAESCSLSGLAWIMSCLTVSISPPLCHQRERRSMSS